MSLMSRGQDTIILNQVVVQGKGLASEYLKPLVSKKVDSLALQSMSTSTMSDLLIQHSPVFIKTYGPGGLSTASFRGTTASHTLVLWNGLQLNTPNLGQVDFSTIPVFLADDIDLKWGSGTATSSGGLGGSVLIDSKNVFGQGWVLHAKQSYGSFNTLGSYLTVGYGSNKVSFRIKAYRSSSDNDFEYLNTALLPPETMRQTNAAFVDYGVMPEIAVLLKKGILTASSWNQWNDRQLPPIMTNVGNVNTSEWSRDGFSRNVLSYKTFWGSGKLDLKSSIFLEHQHYFLETRNPATDDVIANIDSENQSAVYHQIAEVEQHLSEHWKINGKLQWDHEQVKSNYYQDIKQRDIVSAYAALHGEMLRSLALDMTARCDEVDGRFMGIFPTTTLSYQPAFFSHVTATLGYSHNYRLPSLNDLYWYPGGNPDLLPENGRTFDVALRYANGTGPLHFETRVGAYYSQIDNWIQWMPTQFRYWKPENVTLVVAKGLETHIDASLKHRDWKFALSGNYVYAHTTDMGSNAQQSNHLGKQLIYIPRHHGNAFVRAQWKNWSLSYTLEAMGRRATSYSENQFFAYDLPAYVVHHVSAGWHWKQLGVELRCNNVTDKAYQNVLWRPMPGRYFELAVSYQ